MPRPSCGVCRPSALCPCRSQAGAGALGDQFALELRQGREDVKDQGAVRRCGVHIGAGTDEHAGAKAAAVQLFGCRHQMLQVASQAVQLLHDEPVALLQALQAGHKAGPMIMVSRGAVLIDALFVGASFDEGVTLQVKELSTVGRRDACVAVQYGVHSPFRTDRQSVSCNFVAQYARGFIVRIGGILDMPLGNHNMARFPESRKS